MLNLFEIASILGKNGMNVSDKVQIVDNNKITHISHRITNPKKIKNNYIIMVFICYYVAFYYNNLFIKCFFD